MILKINDRIRNRQIDFFNSFSLDLKYDSVASAFSFSFFFNPENQEHVDLACLGHYHIVTVEENGELLLTGYVLSNLFKDSAQDEPVKFSGYSLPGVLEDCEIPTSLYPLQSDGLSIREIAQKILNPFKIQMVIDSEVQTAMNEVITTSTASESQKVKTYLDELAKQKNIILSHDERGRLLFTKAKTNRNPLLNFDRQNGGIPFDSMSLSFNGQAMHSTITVLKQADINSDNAGEEEVKNPYVNYVYRPTVKKQSSGSDNDTLLAAKTARSAELKNIKLVITMDRWVIDGKIIKPNNIISVRNPKVFLFKPTLWFIESVKLVGNDQKQTATLTCVLPEVYNNQTPTYIFEGINTHA